MTQKFTNLNLIVVCDHLGYNWNISDNEGRRFL